MCGICGAIGASDKSILCQMNEILQHRGPDDRGYYIDSNVMLGQCRLSIIDLKTGRQPIYNEDRSVVLVYNGEIYNFRELRKELETKGHSFATNSDTEAVVHAYEEYGVDCLELFNGMFAFALYDSNKHLLLLARDRQGIKPLYYSTLSDGAVVFASEIKSILQYPGIKRALDTNALACFLTLRYVPLEETLFAGIKKILPGHYLIIDRTGLKQRIYWSLRPSKIHHRTSVGELSGVIARSVERHMISDVPVGVYLSGGLDSATLVAFASKLSDRPLNTFCMGFGEETDELADAKAIAEYFGTEHSETLVNEGLLSDFPKMIWHMDFPKRNLYPYYLAQLARKKVKVALSGLGGDELFAGYDFRYSALSSQDPRTPEQRFRAYLHTQACDVPSDQNEVFGGAIPSTIHKCASDFLTPFFTGTDPFMEQVLVADFNAKMTYDFLPVDDATAMAHSIETRVPFLDNELVDLAFNMPFSDKFGDGRGKLVLRKVIASKLPSRALEKKKQGFGPNPYLVYKREIRKYAEDYLPSGRAVKQDLINGEWVKKVLGRPLSPDAAADYNKVWDCLALEVFLRIYFDGDLLDSPTWDLL